MPESAAGCRIDPPVSVPVAAGAMRAATAAAEPPDEPPGTSVRYVGVYLQDKGGGPAELELGALRIAEAEREAVLSYTFDDGSLVVGDHIRAGQTVQFQLRDAATASEDLGALLDLEAAGEKPAGGLLFSCGGRGARLFGVPDHDLGLVKDRLGAFPIAGFFCNGEIGPVGPRNFLHGFTSSLALFVPRTGAPA